MGDPLEEELATHSSTPAEILPWTEEPGGPEPRSGKESDTTEQLSAHTQCENSHEERSSFRHTLDRTLTVSVVPNSFLGILLL